MMNSKRMSLLCIAFYTAINFINIGCEKQSNTMSNNPTPTPATPTPVPPVTTNTKTYLALGDSYTIGESVTAAERFPAQTAALLKGMNINIQPITYIATTGWTTANLSNAIAVQNIHGPYDAVSLLIGVNDQYQRMDTAGYRTRFTQLLQKSIALAGNKPAHVFVLSIPDYGVTPFGGGNAVISKEIDAFNAINKQITVSFSGVTYIDITPSTKMAATDATLTANDGLHPSGKLYAIWAQKLAVEMAKVLK